MGYHKISNVVRREDRRFFLQPFSRREPTSLENGGGGWSKPPLNPIDAFAFVAHLLVQSGAYHHVVTAVNLPEAADAHPVRRIPITRDDVQDAEVSGAQWREQPDALSRAGAIIVPHIIQSWWETIFKHKNDPVFVILPSSDEAPKWWKPAVLILMAADHACKGVGCPVKLANISDEKSKRDRLQAIVEQIRKEAEASGKTPAAITLSSGPPGVLCVTPKPHTSQIGSSIGSLSHNLALLPPHGVVRARWHFGRVADPMKADTEPFRMPLIPFPYAVKASCFRPARETELGPDWGWFEVNQRWLPKRTCPRGSAPDDPNLLMTNADLSALSDADKELTTFVEDLINKAQAEVGGVDALVFPELSLDPVSLGAMQRLAYRKDVAFVLAGVSHGPRRAGNFVAVTRVFAAPPGKEEDDPRTFAGADGSDGVPVQTPPLAA